MMVTKGNTEDNLYFEWLYGQVAAVSNKNPERSYWRLMRKLYEIPFKAFVGNDDNREEDGKDLRDEFIMDCDIQDIKPLWLQLDCSMLEMLIGLSRRASFESLGEPIEWFWKMLENIGLSKFTDHVFNDAVAEEVDRVIDRVVNRTYGRNGDGGLFPLYNAKKDQRRVELWTQLSSYILEGNYLEHGL
ncbi:hypothetical protein SEA_ARCADIA_60 [Arthrobacter phage Arcadia]|uniref:Uncharacterized protein n=4 Tax=Mudcatvirus TaxID=1982088 RepID=A0A222Z7C9_9CAUD|nr:hypothetical protein PQB74_gp60 [Arthrobacter phage Arcadia]ASR80023.1 hypothetical protein SEA_ARCADIA_60 [Arthrobacter phage Arcadia]ASR80216.1 hypothetical protein SEA_ELSA_60 [Arthrobacter phage Elsa]